MMLHKNGIKQIKLIKKMLSDVEVILNDGGSNSSIYNEANFFSFPTLLFYLSAANIVAI
jgi:hypothetical protein